jgi:Methyltransferase domain
MMGLRLHVGCGDDLRPEYVNVDPWNPRADRQVAMQDLDYPDGSVELIEGAMVLEHLTLTDARRFARRAHQMLAPGGRLVLEVPDLEKVSRLVLVFASDPEYLEQGAFGLRGFFGEPTSHMTTGDYHKWGYTPGTARRLLTEAGFSEIEISDGLSHGYPLRDMRIEAVK